MPLDAIDNYGHNNGVCVVQIESFGMRPALVPSATREHHQDADQTAFFVYARAVLRTIAVSLHGLLGVKHRLAITPAARRPNSQRGIGQHALDQGGRQQEHGRNRWLMATLAGTSNAPCGRGWLASTPGEAMPKASGKLSSRANGGR